LRRDAGSDIRPMLPRWAAIAPMTLRVITTHRVHIEPRSCEAESALEARRRKASATSETGKRRMMSDRSVDSVTG
jgi:hypothetical protein